MSYFQRDYQDPLENYFGRQRSIRDRQRSIRDQKQNPTLCNFGYRDSIWNQKIFRPVTGGNVATENFHPAIDTEPVPWRKNQIKKSKDQIWM